MPSSSPNTYLPGTGTINSRYRLKLRFMAAELKLARKWTKGSWAADPVNVYASVCRWSCRSAKLDEKSIRAGGSSSSCSCVMQTANKQRHAYGGLLGVLLSYATFIHAFDMAR